MDKQKLLEILNRNPQAADLSEEEINTILEGLAEMNTQAKEQPEEKKNSFFDEEVWTKLNSLTETFGNSPEWRAKLEAKRRAENLQKGTSKVRSGLQLALGALDLGISASQIARSNESLEQIQKPTRLTPPPINRNLQDALRRSRARLNDPTMGGELAPVRQANTDAFLQDKAAAQTVSRGQPGQYGSLMQGAVNRRYRNNLNMIPHINQIQRQNEANYNNLVDRQMQEDQQRFYRDLALHDRDINMYNRQNEAAGKLGQAGRINMRTSLGNMANYASPYLADAFMRLQNNVPPASRPAMAPKVIDNTNLYNRPTEYSPLGEDFLDYKYRINNNLINRFG